MLGLLFKDVLDVCKSPSAVYHSVRPDYPESGLTYRAVCYLSSLVVYLFMVVTYC